MGAVEPVLNVADEKWLLRTLELIPRVVYGGDGVRGVSKAAKTDDGYEGEGEQRVKRKNNPRRRKADEGKMRRVAKGNDSDSDDDCDGDERKELKEKLQQKIADLRTARKADDEEVIGKREGRKRKRDEKVAEKAKDGKKSKRDQQKRTDKDKAAASRDAAEPAKSVALDAVGGKVDASSIGELAVKNSGVETNRMKGFADDSQKPGSTKRRKLKGDKMKELQRQLELAMVHRNDQEIVNAGRSNAEDNATVDAAKDREIEKALQRAKGVDVRDNVQKLKKTIRKEKRKSEKSKEDWAERVKSLDEERDAKQKRREKNLKERRDSKGKSSKGKSNGKGKGKGKKRS